MGDQAAPLCGIVFCCCWMAFAAITAAVIYNHTNWQKENYGTDGLGTISIEHFSQIAQDWKTKPFTDIIVHPTGRTSSCPISHPHEVFHYTWKGAHEYCDCFEAGFEYDDAILLE